MGLNFKLEGIIDINEEFSYVARATQMGWLTFEYAYATVMENWARDAGIKMLRITDKTRLRSRPGFAFRTEEDRMMFVLVWSGYDS